MSCGQVKNTLIIYFSLTRTSYLVTGQVKILMYLPGGQVKIFRFFLPLTCPLKAKKTHGFNSCIIKSVYPLDILSIKKATEYRNN